MHMLKIVYKNQDQALNIAYVNPDHIAYISGNPNGTTYIKLQGDLFLFAQAPVEDIVAQLADLYS